MLIPYHHPLSEPRGTCWPCVLCAALAAVLIFLALGASFIEGYR